MIHILAYLCCICGIILGLNHHYLVFISVLFVLIVVSGTHFRSIDRYLRFPVCVLVIAFANASLLQIPSVGSVCEGVVDREVSGGQIVSVVSCETGRYVRVEMVVFCRTFKCAGLYTKQKVVVEKEVQGRFSGRYLFPSMRKDDVTRTAIGTVLWIGKMVRDRLFGSFLSVSSSEVASLGVSILFGQTNVSAELSGLLKELGIVHIMAVSGINIAYLMNFVSWLSRGWRKRWRDVVNILVLLLLNCIVGASVSLARATLTYGQKMLWKAAGVQREPNGIFLVLSLMLICSPNLINNYSYLLVSAASIGIYWIVPRVLFAIKEGMLKELLSSLVVWGTVLPVQWLLFKNVTWWGGLLTFVLSPLVESMTIIGYLSVIPSLVFCQSSMLYLVLVSTFSYLIRLVSRFVSVVD